MSHQQHENTQGFRDGKVGKVRNLNRCPEYRKGWVKGFFKYLNNNRDRFTLSCDERGDSYLKLLGFVTYMGLSEDEFLRWQLREVKLVENNY